MRTIRLVTYRPLCYNILGIEAIKKYQLPPFIDASCRREPDLELEFPTISGLCRAEKLAPLLKVGDIVIYMTKHQKYKCSSQYYGKSAYKLTAILEVIKEFDTHKLAYDYYVKQSEVIPSNCIVDENPPLSFDKTTGHGPKGLSLDSELKMKAFLELDEKSRIQEGEKILRKWDLGYKCRSKDYSKFLTTKSIYKEIQNPIPLTKTFLKSVFSKIPVTQTPKKVSEEQYQQILNYLNLKQNQL